MLGISKECLVDLSIGYNCQSQPSFTTFFHNFHSQILFTSVVKICCSKWSQFSQWLMKTEVQNYCESTTLAYNLRSQSYIKNLPHNFLLQPSFTIIFDKGCSQLPTFLNSFFLSNSSPKSKVQTSVLGLGVDFVFPLSQKEEQQQEQEEQQQEEEPPPKSIRRGCTRSLKFDI